MTPYLNSLTPTCLFTIQLSLGMMTIKGSLQLSIPIVKAFFNAKFDVSSSNRSQEGSQNFKSRSHDPFPTPFDLILHFFC